MPEIKKTYRASLVFDNALECCKEYRHEFIMPEHMLYVLLDDVKFYGALSMFYAPELLKESLSDILTDIETVPSDVEYEPEFSVQMINVIEFAIENISLSNATSFDIPHIVNGIFHLSDSWATYLLKDCLKGNEANFMSQLIGYEDFSGSIKEGEGI